MNNVLPQKLLKPRSSDARDTFDAKREDWKFEKLPQEVGPPFDSRLFWLICVPLSAVTVFLMVYAVWKFVSVNP